MILTPTSISPPQETIKEHSSEAPAEVNKHRSRRDQARSTKDDRPVEIPKWAAREAPGNEPRDERHGSADEPEPLEILIDRACAEHAGGTNETPENGGSVENVGVGAGVAVRLVGIANTFDRAERPV